MEYIEKGQIKTLMLQLPNTFIKPPESLTICPCPCTSLKYLHSQKYAVIQNLII